jgi:peptidyl-prolyl cis-trans isomerase SurA
MKKLVLFISLAFLWLSVAFAGPVQSLNSIVAVVNNDIITQSEVSAQMGAMQQQLEAAKQPVPSAAVLKKQVIQQLIDEKLVLQMAHKSGITVSSSQLNAAVASIANHNHLTLAQLKQQVEKQGMKYDVYKKQIHDQILMNAVERQAIGNTIHVSTEEVNSAMKQATAQMQAAPEYHLLGLLVPLAANAPANQVQAAQNQANTIVQQLQQGADFSTVSENQPVGSPAIQGGDMGWEQLSQLPPAIEAQVASAMTGSIVGPIQMPNGFYILKVLAMRTVNVTQGGSTSADLKNQTQQMLYMQKFEKAVNKWVKNLRSTAYIKIMSA